jgi:hypothetical protein
VLSAVEVDAWLAGGAVGSEMVEAKPSAVDSAALALLDRYTDASPGCCNEQVRFSFLPVTTRVNKTDYQGEDCSHPDTSTTDTPSVMRFFAAAAAPALDSVPITPPRSPATAVARSLPSSTAGSASPSPAKRARHSVSRDGIVVPAGSPLASGGTPASLWTCFVCSKEILVPRFADEATGTEFKNAHVTRCLGGSSSPGRGAGRGGSGGSAGGCRGTSPPRQGITAFFTSCPKKSK